MHLHFILCFIMSSSSSSLRIFLRQFNFNEFRVTASLLSYPRHSSQFLNDVRGTASFLSYPSHSSQFLNDVSSLDSLDCVSSCSDFYFLLFPRPLELIKRLQIGRVSLSSSINSSFDKIHVFIPFFSLPLLLQYRQIWVIGFTWWRPSSLSK